MDTSVPNETWITNAHVSTVNRRLTMESPSAKLSLVALRENIATSDKAVRWELVCEFGVEVYSVQCIFNNWLK